MATLPLVSAGRNTLIDVAKSFGPDGKVMTVAELLNQSNEIITYLPFIEGNLPTGHKASVRTGLPSVTLRSFYRGVKVGKSGRATIEDVCAMAEGRNEIDVDLVNLNGNPAAFRLSESLAYIEAMNQMFSQQLIYGDTTRIRMASWVDAALQQPVCHQRRQHHRCRRHWLTTPRCG
jgi:hypothetical protein